jgi:hypothetical protein
MRGASLAESGGRGAVPGPAIVSGRGVSRRVVEIAIGTLGAFAFFLGAAVQFLGDDRYIGLFGWSASLGDVAGAWKVALFALGSLFIGVSFADVRPADLLLTFGSFCIGVSFAMVALRRCDAGAMATPATRVCMVVAAVACASGFVFSVLGVV